MNASRRVAALVVVAALLAMARPLALEAQAPARVLGRVIDAATQAPVPDADVRVGDARTLAGPDGAFILGTVAPGRWRMDVRGIGYAPWTLVLDVLPGTDRTVTVTLTPAAVRLDSVVVRAADTGLTIAGEELARRGPDLGRALDGWEGVVVRRAGSGGPAAPQLRGGGPDEVLVLVDGFALNDPLNGRADLSRIPSRDVARVTLMPGAQTVRFGGRAVAGVIAVETRRDIEPEGTGWAGSHGLRGARAGASTGGLSITASTERYADGFPYTVPEVRGGGEGVRENTGGTLSTASARLDGPVQVTVRGSQSSRGLPGTTTNPTPDARAEDRSLLLGVRAGGAVGGSASLQWIETRARDPHPTAGLPYDSYTHGLGGTVDVSLRRAASVRSWTGTAGAALDARADRFAGDGVRADASFTHAALRLDAALHRGTRDILTVAPALRIQMWTGHARPAVSARLDAGWQRGATAVSAAFGSAVSPPVLADLLFREGVGVRLNPDLRPERVRWEVEAGVRQELAPAGAASVSLRGFYGRVEDMVIWAPDFRFIWSPHNFDVRRHGGEANISLRPLGWLRTDATATVAAVTYDVPGGAQVQYRPRFTGAVGLAATLAVWSADLRWHYIGQRYPNSAGTNPRPSIALLDAGVERRFGAWLTGRLDAHDLTDARAEFLAGYPSPGRSMTLTLTLQAP